jgi:hypothetical protein
MSSGPIRAGVGVENGNLVFFLSTANTFQVLGPGPWTIMLKRLSNHTVWPHPILSPLTHKLAYVKWSWSINSLKVLVVPGDCDSILAASFCPQWGNLFVQGRHWIVMTLYKQTFQLFSGQIPIILKEYLHGGCWSKLFFFKPTHLSSCLTPKNFFDVVQICWDIFNK